MKRTFLVVLMISIAILAQAQPKQTTHVSQLWLAYFNQTRLSKKWGIWGDFQLRTRDHFTNRLSVGLARAGLTYYIDDNTRVTLGYAYVNHYPANDNITISQPEHRPWQQIQWFTKNKNTRIMQYLRLEERYRQRYLNNTTLDNSWQFNYKFRYNFFYQLPLQKKGLLPKTYSFVFNDEVHVNFGKQIVNNYFDQNRLFLGINYAFTPNQNLQIGYLNTFIQLPAGNQYRNINALRLVFLQNIDLSSH